MKPWCTIRMDSVLFHLEVPLWSQLCTCSIFNSIPDSLLAWLHPVQLQLLFCLKDSLCFSSREDGSRVYSYLKLGINEGLEDVLKPFDIL